MSFDTPVKQEHGRGGGSGGAGKSPTMDINFNKIDKQAWRNAYGETRVNGKVVILCWFHCNRPGGCIKKDGCQHDHHTFPQAYKGKALEKCTTAFQKEVLDKCKGT